MKVIGGRNKDKDRNAIHREEVKGVVVIGDLVCYELAITNTHFGDRSRRLHYYAVKEDGLYLVQDKLVREKDGKQLIVETLSYHPPLCILKPASNKVQKWVCNYIMKTDNKEEGSKLNQYFVQYSDTVSHEGKDVEAVVVDATAPNFFGAGPNSFGDLTWYLPKKGKIKLAQAAGKVGNDRDREAGWAFETVSFTGRNSLAIGKVILNEKTIEKTGRTDLVESEVGGETTYSKTRTIRQEISYSVKIGLGAEVEAKLGASILAVRGELTGKIKASVAGELGEKWTAKITETATHKINLDKYPKVKVIWLDVYRTGTVEVTQDGAVYAIPFEFPIATRTILKAVK
jgi:hypothetical protein